MRLTRYYKVKDTGCKYLKAECYYSLGGHNVWTSRNETRGYYLSVSPVERNRGFESYIAFSGSKVCIVPCERKGKKKYEEAKVLFAEKIDKVIADYFSQFKVDFNDYEEQED